MTTFLTNRVQSAHSRSTYRSGGTNGQDPRLKQRPMTGVGGHKPFTDLFDEAALKALEPADFSPPPFTKTSSTT